MNRTSFIFFLGLTSLLGSAIVSSAQEHNKPLPPPPYLADLPESAKWYATAEQPTDSSSAVKPTILSVAVASISVNKTPAGRTDVTKYAGGTEQTAWLVNGYEATKYSTGFVTVHVISASPGPKWLDSMDLNELDWIKTAKPQSWSQYGGRECLYFEADVPDPLLSIPSKGGHAFTVKMKAWIDPETRLPVAFNDGIQTLRYSFQGASGEAFSLPAEVSTVLQRYIKRSKALY